MKKTKINLVEKYPRIFQDYQGNPMGINWSIPNGWEHIIDWLCGSIQEYIDNVKINGESPQQVMCLQIKEKFGQLEFYYIGGNDEIEGMVWYAQYLSKKTCIKCGTMKNVKMKKTGWIMPLCSCCNNETWFCYLKNLFVGLPDKIKWKFYVFKRKLFKNGM